MAETAQTPYEVITELNIRILGHQGFSDKHSALMKFQYGEGIARLCMGDAAFFFNAGFNPIASSTAERISLNAAQMGIGNLFEYRYYVEGNNSTGDNQLIMRARNLDELLEKAGHITNTPIASSLLEPSIVDKVQMLFREVILEASANFLIGGWQFPPEYWEAADRITGNGESTRSQILDQLLRTDEIKLWRETIEPWLSRSMTVHDLIEILKEPAVAPTQQPIYDRIKDRILQQLPLLAVDFDAPEKSVGADPKRQLKDQPTL